jgi:hypothetical protein
MKQLLDDTITFSSAHIPEHCSVCVLAKHKQSFIRTPMECSRIPFELIYSDVCGPMLTPSLSKACYYIVYIDDATRFARIFFLKSKSASAVLPVFKEYMAWVDAQGFRIKRFRCDNGIGEFDNNEFWNLLALSGIAFEPAPPFTQHKNGTVERYIQTINGKARSMMLDSHMPHRFWAEAVNTAMYLHSISPTKTLVKSQSPHEALYGRRPPIAHLRRFGCLVYKHIPKEQRMDKNWGPRSLPCMFVGYAANTTKIWQIYDFSTRTVSRASNVVFVKESMLMTLPVKRPVQMKMS